jgi:hypothetical protein
MKQFPKMFTSDKEEECDKILNLDMLKLKKINHPEKYTTFLQKFKEKIIRFADRDDKKQQIQQRMN